ncbi:MAG: hypothetical protein KC496_07835 [Anaerolineae bacterium]|nr:hypothetical protein [Anaerolineae bacterium]
MQTDFADQIHAWEAQPSKQVMQSFLGDVRGYVSFVNKVSELLRLTDDAAGIELDGETTVADLMHWVIQRGERLQTSADMLHDYVNGLAE